MHAVAGHTNVSINSQQTLTCAVHSTSTSGPRGKRQRKARTVYTAAQLQVLNHRFNQCQYLSLAERASLAAQLRLTETQVSFRFIQADF